MQEARRFQLFFVFFGLFFVLAFAYLLFLNTGLALEIESSGKEVKLIVKNNSIHTIKEIKVEQIFDSEKQLIALLPELKPAETKTLQLKKLVNSIIEVSAPFHATVRKELDVEGLGLNTQQLSLNVKLKAADYAFLDVNYAIKLELCNQSDSNVAVSVTANFSSFFLPSKDSATITIAANKCAAYSTTLKPVKKGRARIVFNLNVDNYSRTIEKFVNVEE
ncbi:MAG: hypothetical protein J7L14_02435 [Candidatus Diapherotrites archaeon]|nr:hypothetical protein [Candidatus Diapherotrites archaeon]